LTATLLIGRVVFRNSIWAVFIYIILCEMHHFGNVRSSNEYTGNFAEMSPHFLLGERYILEVLDNIRNQVLHFRQVENRMNIPAGDSLTDLRGVFIVFFHHDVDVSILLIAVLNAFLDTMSEISDLS
jgi:hypothetical protein